jgi:hypothetical protein
LICTSMEFMMTSRSMAISVEFGCCVQGDELVFRG